MKTLLLSSGKGGVGKSTLARTIAVAAAQAGGKVLLIDLDPQQTTAKWWRKREAENVDLLGSDPDPKLLKEALAGARRTYDWVVIDTPPSSPAWMEDVMRQADLAIVPARPSPDDIEAIGMTVGALRRAGTEFCFVLTQVPPRGRLVEESARALAATGRLCPTNVGLRVSHQEAALAGQTVIETGDIKAAGEALGLWKYIEEIAA